VAFGEFPYVETKGESATVKLEDFHAGAYEPFVILSDDPRNGTMDLGGNRLPDGDDGTASHPSKCF